MGNCCVSYRNKQFEGRDLLVDIIGQGNIKVNYNRSSTINVFPKVRVRTIIKNDKENNCENALNWIRQETKRFIPSSKEFFSSLLGVKMIGTQDELLRLWSHFTNRSQNIDNCKNDIIMQKNGKYPNQNMSKENFFREITDSVELPKLEVQKIHNALTNNILFAEFNDNVIQMIITNMVKLHVSNGQYVYQKGFEGDFFFLIAKGKVNTIAGDDKIVIKTYNEWECFSHMSLLCGKKERKVNISAIAEGEVILYVIDGENFNNIQRQMMKLNLEDKFNFINQISLLKELDKIQKFNIAEKVLLKQYSIGEIINDEENIIMVKQGKVEIENDKRATSLILYEGDLYGEEKLFNDNKVIITQRKITCVEQSVIYHIYIEGLNEALGAEYKQIILLTLFKNFVYKHEFFKTIFSEKNIMTIFNSFKVQQYKKGELLIKEGESLKKIVLILKGEMQSSQNNKLQYDTSNIIGENVIKSKCDIEKDIIAMSDCITLESDYSRISHILNLNESNCTLKEIKKKNALKKYSLFKLLNENLLHNISQTMKKEKFTKDDTIVQEGKAGDSLYLIKKGNVRITRNGSLIRELQSGSFFGEMALIEDNNKRTATVIALNNVTCYVFSKSNFDIIFKSNSLFKKYIYNKISTQDNGISLSELYYDSRLGNGKFGNVFLVHDRKNYYGLKTVSIKQATKDEMVKYLFTERNIMLTADHPFIIKLVKTFKDESFCYFLIEFINGEVLSNYLRNRCMLKNVDEVKFYSAIVLLILDYLQVKCIAHRDIKPSNLIIDSTGFLRLIDFGIAKIINDYTSTLVGTPQYLAPELLKGKGYSMSCDYWSLGIVAYEIFYGKCPFGNSALDVMGVYKSILYDDIDFGNAHSKSSENVTHFIKCLLKKTVNKRVCKLDILRKLPLFQEIKNSKNKKEKTLHFEQYDYFDKILDNKITPPYIPRLKERKIKKEGNYIKFIDFKEKGLINVNDDIRKENEEEKELDYKWVEDF